MQLSQQIENSNTKLDLQNKTKKLLIKAEDILQNIKTKYWENSKKYKDALLALEKLRLLPKFSALDSKVWVYEHCHQRALADTDNFTKVLGLIPRLKIGVISGGCCGMAGDFGYKNLELSRKIAQNSLDVCMKEVNKDRDVMIATGFSCRRQILDVYGIKSSNLSYLLNSQARNNNAK